MYRGVKIELPDGSRAAAGAACIGSYYWWGGKANLTNAMMTTKSPIAIPAGAAPRSTFDLAYDIETEWDFLWVQASTDGGTTWKTLTNTNTICDARCGLDRRAVRLPRGPVRGRHRRLHRLQRRASRLRARESSDLSAFAGQNVLLRFWYMTDWGTTYDGPFVDNVQVRPRRRNDALLRRRRERRRQLDLCRCRGQRNDGTQTFTHNYYLQWRNVNANGGYDSALGDSRWRFGPANTGLLVWYNNNFYTDNEIFNYLIDYPGFGPKGRMLVVDAHPEPYRDPYLVAYGYNNEAAT